MGKSTGMVNWYLPNVPVPNKKENLFGKINSLSTSTGASASKLNSKSGKNGSSATNFKDIHHSMSNEPVNPRRRRQSSQNQEGTEKVTSSAPVKILSEEEKAARKKEKKERQKQRKLKQQLFRQQQNGKEETTEKVKETVKKAIPVLKDVEIGLFKSPCVTLQYFYKEIPCQLQDAKYRLLSLLFGDVTAEESRAEADLFRILISSFVLSFVLILVYIWVIADTPGKESIGWYLYWIVLGVLSSVGLGTGLHTFVLYLGPFTGKVALAAQVCSSLNFPRPPYPDELQCPSNGDGGQIETPSILEIMSKVRWESFAWGFGTALGELPPYFVARAARSSNKKPIYPHQASSKVKLTSSCTTTVTNIEDIDKHVGCGCSLMTTIQCYLRRFVLKAGFVGILLCASIPNPLFDLAGITCGHFGVPFVTFFGATVLGKMVIKSQIQTFFVILGTNEVSLAKTKDFLSRIPIIGDSLRNGLEELVDYEKSALRDQVIKSGGSLIFAIDVIVFLMIGYFLTSIINGFAQNYKNRILQKSKKNQKGRKTSKASLTRIIE